METVHCPPGLHRVCSLEAGALRVSELREFGKEDIILHLRILGDDVSCLYFY